MKNDDVVKVYIRTVLWKKSTAGNITLQLLPVNENDCLRCNKELAARFQASSLRQSDGIIALPRNVKARFSLNRDNAPICSGSLRLVGELSGKEGDRRLGYTLLNAVQFGRGCA